MKFKGDIIITDPCYVIDNLNEDDWDKCDYGYTMENLNIFNYLIKDTLCGAWNCTTYNSNTSEKIGKFCSIAGLVSVFLLSEVLAYNPSFNDHIKHPATTTLIKDFDGEVKIEIIEDEVSVVGVGNINFHTKQNGI